MAMSTFPTDDWPYSPVLSYMTPLWMNRPVDILCYPESSRVKDWCGGPWVKAAASCGIVLTIFLCFMLGTFGISSNDGGGRRTGAGALTGGAIIGWGHTSV